MYLADSEYVLSFAIRRSVFELQGDKHVLDRHNNIIYIDYYIGYFFNFPINILHWYLSTAARSNRHASDNKCQFQEGDSEELPDCQCGNDRWVLADARLGPLRRQHPDLTLLLSIYLGARCDISYSLDIHLLELENSH